jgi:hypothetical protein
MLRDKVVMFGLIMFLTFCTGLFAIAIPIEPAYVIVTLAFALFTFVTCWAAYEEIKDENKNKGV